MLTAIIVGLLLGFFLSMPPMGPTNFAIMFRGFRGQLKEGLAIGTGAGFMDMFYIMVAYGGVTLFITILPGSVISFFEENELIVKIIGALLGSLVVIFYGLGIMKQKVKLPEEDVPLNEEMFKDDIQRAEEVLHMQEEKMRRILHVEKTQNSSFFKGFTTGIVLCLSSITLPASWVAIVGYLKSMNLLDSNLFTGFLFGLAVLIGTVIWFYTLLKLLSKYAHKVKPSGLKMINKIAGIILVAIGVYLVLNVLHFALS